MRTTATTTPDLTRQPGRYREGMAGTGSIARRLAFAVLAVMAIVAMHGSSVSAHACEHGDHAMQPREEHGHTGVREPAGSSGSIPQHCGPVACSAVVAPAPQPGTVRANPFASVRPEQHRSPSDTPAALEPPVPRSSSHD